MYDSRDKAGKLLAQQARQAQSSRLIPKICSQTGETITDHLEINNTFKHFCSNLYSSECDDNCPQFNPFFNNLQFPSVPAEQNSLLGGAISNAEFLKAINSLKCNKTPGPNGYSSELHSSYALCSRPCLMNLCHLDISHQPYDQPQ